jgi:hypothetical protein
MYPSDKQKQKEFHRLYSLALDLLNGTRGPDKRGVHKRVFLSAKTKPTEEEARRALCRILRYWERCVGADLLGAIANVFDPNGSGERRVVFKKLSQGHSDPVRDGEIANMVYWQLFDLRDEGDVRNDTKVCDAYETVGEEVGLTPERVKRICAADRKRKGYRY